MSVNECYRVLGVRAGSDMDAVKTAFRQLAFKLHPDLNDSEDAADRFRKVNEAYVTLRKTLGETSTSGARAKPGEEGRDRSHGKAYKRPDEGARAYQRQQRSTKSEPGPGTRQKQRKKWEPGPESTRSRSQRFYYKEEEVFRDLMNDPFARQVFEDIYNRVDKNRPHGGPLKLKRRKLSLELRGKKLELDLSDGILGSAKNWVRSHLDDELTAYFPASVLMPGRKIRITVHRRFSNEPRTIEVTLPSDFHPGRPIRLRSLGKQVGPWKGDLLLKVYPEEARPTK